MAMDQLHSAFIHVTSWVRLHLFACVPLFHTSGSTGRIMLKYGLLLYPLTQHFYTGHKQSKSTRAQVQLQILLSTSVHFSSFIAQKASYWFYWNDVVLNLRLNQLRREMSQLNSRITTPEFFPGIDSTQFMTRFDSIRFMNSFMNS